MPCPPRVAGKGAGAAASQRPACCRAAGGPPPNGQSCRSQFPPWVRLAPARRDGSAISGRDDTTVWNAWPCIRFYPGQRLKLAGVRSGLRTAGQAWATWPCVGNRNSPHVVHACVCVCVCVCARAKPVESCRLFVTL